MIQYLGLFSIIAMWAGTAILIKKQGFTPSKTISQHAAQTDASHRFFALLELFIVGIFFLFLFNWLTVEYNLHALYRVFTLIALVCVAIAAVVPHRLGKQEAIHSAAAYSMAALLLYMTLLLAISDNAHVVVKAASLIGVLYMIIGWLIIPINKAFFLRNIFITQALYFLAFQIPIILAIFLPTIS